MADIVQNKNIGALLDEAVAFTGLSWTAGGASDSVTWTGYTVDREGFATGSMPRSLDAVVLLDATIASGATLALSWDLQTSPDGVSWTDYATEAATTVLTGQSGGGRLATQKVRLVVQSTADNPSPGPGVQLQSAQRYVRLNVRADLSSAGTDTAIMNGVMVFGGWDQLAAPAV